ncbi:MAG: hypothetical protein IH977_04335 [Nitrospinae bacterium]|nr:hypothetical protein [Nitrospinota bacterium]
MTIERGRRALLDHLAGTGIILMPILLDLPTRPSWADGTDSEGRTVVLIGRHMLERTEVGQEWTRIVLDSLEKGHIETGCHEVIYKPKASLAFAEIVGGDAMHKLLDGPRASGKTQVIPGALLALAELHARAGFPLPLRPLWLHDTLTNATEKTGESLKLPMWGGLWALKDDSRKAVCTLAGVEMVEARFVGCLDASASELLRYACHVVCVEELVRTQSDEGGITETDYSVATSSMFGREPTVKNVVVSTSNPGSPSGWVYENWIKDGGKPDHVRCQVPASDRLSAGDIDKLRASFPGSPELQKRLVEGQWVAVQLGKMVAEGFNAALHVSKERVRPIVGEPIFLGQDFGLTPATVIGQPVGGALRIYAALPCERGGVRQHFEGSVIPWLTAHAPWVLRNAITYVRGCYDPAGESGEDSDSDQNAIATVEKMIGGIWNPGPVRWPPRHNCLLKALNLHVAPGQPAVQLDPVECVPLIEALNGGWYYHVDAHGTVSRDLPKKPNHPAEDLGDAFIYLLNEMMGVPSQEMRHIKVETEFDPREPASLVGPQF